MIGGGLDFEGSAGAGASSVACKQDDSAVRRIPAHGTKTRAVLDALLERGAAGVNMFEFERIGEHAAASTVCTLQRSLSIRIDRRMEEVPTRFGKPCRVARYWLADDEAARVCRMIADEAVRRMVAGELTCAATGGGAQ